MFREPKAPAKRQHSSTNLQHVVPGELLTTETAFLRGHGTYVQDNRLYSTVSGVVERVNKLVSVRPLKFRYFGEVGDVVVGRITEVGQKRWKVDLNGRQDAMLALSAIQLPGGVQRRRTTEDELNIRSFFVENDLISAEVQQFHSDGSIALHTRSLKYGKLVNGQFVSVPCGLMKRTKQTFHSLGCGVNVILGTNGYIWISPTPTPTELQEQQLLLQNYSLNDPTTPVQPNPKATIDIHTRENICRVRNAIVVLAKQFLAIHPVTIIDVYEESIHHKLQPKEMLDEDWISIITTKAAEHKID